MSRGLWWVLDLSFGSWCPLLFSNHIVEEGGGGGWLLHLNHVVAVRVLSLPLCRVFVCLI